MEDQNKIPLDEQEPESLKLDEVQDEASAEPKSVPEPLVKAHEDLVLSGESDDAILRTKLKLVQFPLSRQAREDIVNLETICLKIWDEKIGTGLAMNQIGRSTRAFCAMLNWRPVIFINPVIIAHSESKFNSVEFCLSAPGIGVRMRRWKDITVSYFDEDGSEKIWRSKFKKQAALVQHEIQHTLGILITDYMDPKKKNFGYGMKERNLN